MSIRIEAGGNTDVGKVRASNQDSFLVKRDDDLYIVADGMGGHAGGEIASSLCVEQVSDFLKRYDDVFQPQQSRSHPDARIANTLAHAINHASTKIYEKALEDPSLKGMGTTATVCKIVDGRAYIAHVGDSRLYLIRCGYIYQITHDHSLVSEQVRAGLITEEEAEMHHLRNVITRSVGYQEEEDVDTTCMTLEPDDLIVICSDGLHGPVTDKEISNMTQDKGVEAVDELIALANERGGEDNISVVIVSVDEGAKPS